jgi:hypothetical protein
VLISLQTRDTSSDSLKSFLFYITLKLSCHSSAVQNSSSFKISFTLTFSLNIMSSHFLLIASHILLSVSLIIISVLLHLCCLHCVKQYVNQSNIICLCLNCYVSALDMYIITFSITLSMFEKLKRNDMTVTLSCLSTEDPCFFALKVMLNWVISDKIKSLSVLLWHASVTPSWAVNINRDLILFYHVSSSTVPFTA